jgi:hypothetical protein
MKILVLLIISLLVNVWFSFVIIKLESFHYSTQIGICGDYKDEIERIKVLDCLEKSEPRTSDWWNLLYGLKIL